jgi:hypothetical protein
VFKGSANDALINEKFSVIIENDRCQSGESESSFPDENCKSCVYLYHHPFDFSREKMGCKYFSIYQIKASET